VLSSCNVEWMIWRGFRSGSGLF